ncbi:hypothetical protein K435DRAFT_838998 [Dendrothele bispora CBS 962.96]|uniref:Uncharacterized protein n=1 Tax=Dendrothele bispora (strain CBS 962.96) TaxID=1314807 RepID=A0A4S8M3D1_DENBC|nr:hypothetical protein K435DRAFT_838998 [Dendrothele bispora CBS 962.96]
MSQFNSNSTLLGDHQFISQVQTGGLTVALCGLFYDKVQLDMVITEDRDKIILRGDMIENIFFGFNAMLSDGVVVWRAWVLVNKRCRLFLICCLTGTIAGVVGSTIHSTTVALNTFQQPDLDSLILFLPLLLTNAIATAMIWHKLWCYHKAVVLYIKDGHNLGKTSVEKILFILVESGLMVLTSLVIITTLKVTQLSSNFNQVIAGSGTQLNYLNSEIILTFGLRWPINLKYTVVLNLWLPPTKEKQLLC